MMIDDAEKRRILNQLALLDHLYRRRGTVVLADIREYEIERMRTIWTGIAQDRPNGVHDLVEILWNSMGKEIGMEFEVERVTPSETRIVCRSCPFAELARSRGFENVGFALYCMGDHGIVEGFNPKIRFERTKTLMEGNTCCDHRYLMV